MMTSSCGIRQTLEAVKDVYKSSPRAGIACGIKNTGIGNGMEDVGRVAIEVVDGGRLEVLTGYTEMGQGLHTILRQVVCQETGLQPEIMTVQTTSGPDIQCGMTTASRATALCTAAGQIAARQLAGTLADASLEELVGRRFHGEFICDFTTAPGTNIEDPVTHMEGGRSARCGTRHQSAAVRGPDRGRRPHGARVRPVRGFSLYRRQAGLSPPA
jgi:CO/xanthine dehydrogenase Mo-binding subunit